MKPPSISAAWRLDPQKSQSGWQPVTPSQQPLQNRAFARHVAERHYCTQADLVLGLEKAFFQPADGLIPRDRRRYLVALAKLVKYMGQNSFPPAIVTEFVEMFQALSELDEGRSREWLKPAKAGRGRKIDPGDVWQARALVAIALDVLINARIDKGDALDLIDSEFGFFGDSLLSTDSGTFRGALGKWHQDFVARFGCEARAQEMFDARTGLIEATAADIQSGDPQIIAVHILNLASFKAARASNAAAVERLKKRLARLTPKRN